MPQAYVTATCSGQGQWIGVGLAGWAAALLGWQKHNGIIECSSGGGNKCMMAIYTKQSLKNNILSTNLPQKRPKMAQW